MGNYIINIGEPDEDAFLLNYGFGKAEEKGRTLFKEFSLDLPADTSKQVQVKFYFLCQIAQKIELFLPERKISRKFDKGNNIFEFTLKSQGESRVKIKGRTSCDRNRQLKLQKIELFGPEELAKINNGKNPYQTKPWRVQWADIELEHKKFQKVIREPSDYSQDISLFFGDLHIHTHMSRCAQPYNGTIEENYDYAQNERELDFAAVTDHGEHMTEKQWQDCMQLARNRSISGDFTAIPAVEWTSKLYGHRNIYYNDYQVPLMHSDDPEVDTPSKLWEQMRQLSTSAFTIPHHQARAEWICDVSQIDPELEPAMEIFSGWGNEEYPGAPLQATERTLTGNFAQDLLTKGHKIGFVGGGDGHPARPGTNSLTGVYADSHSLKDIFKAILHRRTYATTGAKIKLDFIMNGYPMGSVLKCNQYTIDRLFPLEFGVEIEGTANIEKVEIIENAYPVYARDKRRCRGNEISFTHFIPKVPFDGHDFINIGECNVSRYYYLRVTQTDGDRAWSSPIWVDFEIAEK